ncbi:UDP-N-acetylmuramoyl-L-alanyl-D-glutamate--2,6-diaminopimelate ligase [Halofilum ochraceum]|uniref:UDP-N-acetylmuramoyl-L-alanyl-D-glutamate--2, 6-diaminopimelate ligase n=1 Tax=Halofilum ochraceum TaxID=1611323 RepID=UPI0008DA7476|nr:UDP-N-acetylmuramoyl-L-alanyl-D-glutamate--2,6-diaminopimelate ligase [Halofilum ochraceum]
MMAAALATDPRALTALCAGLTGGAGIADTTVTDLTLDSRRVTPGAGFVALAGTRTHGLDFLDAALRAGAGAVLFDADDPRWTDASAERCRTAGVPAVGVSALARQLGTIAARFWLEPAEALEAVIAVTGTDGKTSVSHFIAAMLDEPDAPAAVLGTLGRGRSGQTTDAGLTTPDAIGVQAALAALVDDGARRVALEASSHGLAQYRLDGTRIDVAVLTQLGRDHLDYHADEAAYAAAKARLFAWPGLKAAVLNGDDRFGRALREDLDPSVRAVTWGRSRGDVYVNNVVAEPGGLRFELVLADTVVPVSVPLIGGFNIDNVLAACGALVALGYGPDEIARRLRQVQPVAGRMEAFQTAGRATVVVDYAHNAGSLAAALAALREHFSGRIWCIFGAGGDRDKGKRPLMAAAAAAGADRIVVTDDNPRHEDPDAIVAEILAGLPADQAVTVERDRERALALALREADPADVILLAGKGHESVQIRGDETLAWSDREAARRQLGLTGGVVS